MSPLFEIIWPNQDKHLKAFVRQTETPGVLWFEIKVARSVVLVGAMSREDLIEFLPTLKTFNNKPTTKAGA